jgi:PIN domain nuclease of toxin-antitoxin system
MRNLLIDTHIFLWSQFDPAKLSRELLALRSSPDVRWHLSQVSIWEIQIKFDLGKLPLPEAPWKLLPRLIAESGFAYRTLQNDAIFMLGKLPSVHRDPFDRMLIATAIVNGWEVVTNDDRFEAYPVRTLN